MTIHLRCISSGSGRYHRELSNRRLENLLLRVLDRLLHIKVDRKMLAVLVRAEPLAHVNSATLTQTVSVVGWRGLGNAECGSEVGVAQLPG